MKLKRCLMALTCLLLALLLCACTINPAMAPEEQKPAREDSPPVEEAPPVEETPAEEPEEPEEPEETGLALPYVTEDGCLTVSSLFTSDITNPDKGDEMTEGLASLQVANSGGSYVERADITVQTLAGQLLHFVVNNLPAGESVLAFDVDGIVLTEDKVDTIAAECSVTPEAGIPEGIAVLVDGDTITVKNEMDVDLADVTVIYRCRMGDSYFGGISYSQTIEVLPHGSREVLTADECLLGSPEVVSVSIG